MNRRNLLLLAEPSRASTRSRGEKPRLTLRHLLIMGLFPVLISQSTVSNASTINVEWIQQFGTDQTENAYGVSADALGNVFVTGGTRGQFIPISSGNEDVFLTKLDAAGNIAWTQQIGSNGTDRGTSVAADGLGNVVVAGLTTGGVGGVFAGGDDAFVAKYDNAGNQVWISQFGTSDIENGLGVVTDRLGNVFVSGRFAASGVEDAFLRKFDSSGGLLWEQTFGAAASDQGLDVSTDNQGNAYVVGFTEGDLEGVSAGNRDAYIRKYDPAGGVVWTRQFGTSADDGADRVSVDGLGNVYVAGGTGGNLGGPYAGANDGFLSKYDEDGNLAWTQQLGTTANELIRGLSADGHGSVYIAGTTQGDLGGTNAGIFDSFVSKFDDAGNLLWTEQFGTTTVDFGGGVSADGLGNVYLAGHTLGELEQGGIEGGFDAFVLKIADEPIPEPSTAITLGLLTFCLGIYRLKHC